MKRLLLTMIVAACLATGCKYKGCHKSARRIGNDSTTSNYDGPAPVPVPGALLLTGLGTGIVASLRRRFAK